MPEHFQTRNDMIKWLIANCPRPAIVRALEANRVEFLGGFKLIPPSNLPGWIFKITTLGGKIKNVVILANDLKLKYEIRIVKRVPWENWAGDFCGLIIPGRIHNGDKPLQYKELWNDAKSNRPTEDV